MNAIAFTTLSARPVLLDRQPSPLDLGVRMNYGRDEEVFGEGEASRYVYRVLSGAVRTYRVLSDGRRQIVEFHTPGDVFGLDGEDRHALGAEAVRDTVLQVMRRDAFLHDQGSEAAIRTLLKKFHRAQAHMLLLGRHTACERVAAFLLDFRERAGSDAIDLPMSRQDIADYLGLTIETVSRTFTQLQGAHQIDLVSCRRVILRHPEALERICE
ncbi:MAG: helix-turn-helix domain-containing protein [Caulobacteraceae bacterium]